MTARLTQLGEFLTPAKHKAPVDPASVYQMMGVRSFGVGAFAAADLRGTDTSYATLQRVQAGDVVYPKLMAWEGAFAVVTEDMAGRWVSPEFCIFSADPNKVCIDYLRQLIAWSGFRDLLLPGSTGTNARRRRLQPEAFLAHSVLLPDLPEQHRIASHLDSVAATATHVARSVDECIRQGGSLLEQVVQDRGAARRPIGDLLERDRAWMTLEDSQVYAPVGVRGFNRGIIHYPPTPRAELSKLRYYRLRPNRLLVSNIKAWEGAVTLTGLKDKGRITSNRFLQYECASSDILLPYLHRYLVSSEGINQLQTASPGSADRNRTLSIESFESIQVPVPDLEIQRRITMTGSLVEKLLAVARSKARIAGALLPAARNEVFSAMR